MIFLKRSGRFHMVTVSIAGGVFHNVGQILVAMMVLGSTYVFYYLPVLWVSGLAAGALIGFLGAQVVRRLPDTLV
jgi:heptaprenyl diphosphate synthase